MYSLKTKCKVQTVHKSTFWCRKGKLAGEGALSQTSAPLRLTSALSVGHMQSLKEGVASDPCYMSNVTNPPPFVS